MKFIMTNTLFSPTNRRVGRSRRFAVDAPVFSLMLICLAVLLTTGCKTPEPTLSAAQNRPPVAPDIRVTCWGSRAVTIKIRDYAHDWTGGVVKIVSCGPVITGAK